MAQAHEVLPSIADMTRTDDGLVFDVELNLESFIAGIDQASTLDTNDAAEADFYDELRALEPAELDAAFQEFWPEMASKINVIVDGTRGEPELTINHDEVAAVFEVPLSFLMDQKNHNRESRIFKEMETFYYTMPYTVEGADPPHEWYIWGLTAGIIRMVQERLYGAV